MLFLYWYYIFISKLPYCIFIGTRSSLVCCICIDLLCYYVFIGKLSYCICIDLLGYYIFTDKMSYHTCIDLYLIFIGSLYQYLSLLALYLHWYAVSSLICSGVISSLISWHNASVLICYCTISLLCCISIYLHQHFMFISRQYLFDLYWYHIFIGMLYLYRSVLVPYLH